MKYLFSTIPIQQNAMKAAGNELRAVTRFFQASYSKAKKLCIPLIATCEFHGTCNIGILLEGYRLLAVAVLPISEKTIVYGKFAVSVVIVQDLLMEDGSLFRKFILKKKEQFITQCQNLMNLWEK